MTATADTRLPRIFFILLGICLLGAPLASQAQIVVSLKMASDKFLPYEPMKATVSVVNRVGRDVILDGPGEGSWLSFGITDQEARMVGAQPGQEYMAEPTILRAGQTLMREVYLTAHYSIFDLGVHGITARVFYADEQQYFSSNRAVIQISEGRVFWEQLVGVPDGQPGAGGLRRYALLTYRDLDETRIYVRVKDERSGTHFGTYSMGRMIEFHDPQVVTDGGNHLHVLFMAAPQMYRHITVGTSGEFMDQEIFREADGTRPALMLANTGEVNVRGGKIYDTAGAVATGNGGGGEAGEIPAGVRTMSDRPQ